MDNHFGFFHPTRRIFSTNTKSLPKTSATFINENRIEVSITETSALATMIIDSIAMKVKELSGQKDKIDSTSYHSSPRTSKKPSLKNPNSLNTSKYAWKSPTTKYTNYSKKFRNSETNTALCSTKDSLMPTYHYSKENHYRYRSSECLTNSEVRDQRARTAGNTPAGPV
ncbi:MAG: hypothetical protein KatS3mg027_1336 [Bacteroidia bacterium]|nr:MAG: hypothetical protein KatS3mg027_1336 [Bacteroidia bacterium]